MTAIMGAGTVREFRFSFRDVEEQDKSPVHSISWLVHGNLRVMVSTISNGSALVWVYAPTKGVQWLNCHIRLADNNVRIKRVRVLVC